MYPTQLMTDNGMASSNRSVDSCRFSDGLRISVAVGLSAQLRLPGQGNRGILCGHDDFDQLHFFSLVELLVLEEGIQLSLVLDHIRNGGILVPSKSVQDLRVVPTKEVKGLSDKMITVPREAYHEAMLLYCLCMPLMYFSMVYPLLFRTKTIGVNLWAITVDSS